MTTPIKKSLPQKAASKPPKTPRETPRVWQRMLSGRRLDLLNPSPMDIEIEDIAHGLAFVARWNGQTLGEYPYSVAQHSVFVEHLFSRLNPQVEDKWRLAALLHDAPEYVIGDMINPVKSHIGEDYARMDERLTIAIHQKFALPGILPDLIKKQIKRADKISAWVEAVHLAGFQQQEANVLFSSPALKDVPSQPITPLPPMQVKAAFLARSEELVIRG